MWNSQYDENLQNNPFFTEIITNHTTLVLKASQDGWLICVPRSVAACFAPITTDIIADHVLMASRTTPSFVTLSHKEVTIRNKAIIPNDPAAAPVHILFDETFYCEGLKYSVLCVDKPLFMSCDARDPPTLETLHDCIDFLWGENVGHILGKIQGLCMNFLENNPGFGMEDSQSVKDLVKGLLAQCLGLIPDPSVEIEWAVETYMQSCLEGHLVKAINTLTCFSDAAFNKIVRNSADLQFKDFNLPKTFCDNIADATSELDKINNYSTVLDKINCLKLTIGHLNKVCLTADVILQILVLLIVRLSIGNWISNLVYMTHFRFSPAGASGESAFLVASFEAAIEFIKSDRFSELKSSKRADSPLFQSHLATSPQRPHEGDSGPCHPLCDCANCVDGRDLTTLNSKGQDVLIHAAILGEPHTVQRLIDGGGGDVAAADYSGKTALHHACLEGHQDVLFVLASCGAEVNLKDKDGNTPLHLAVNNKHNSCVKALLYTTKDLQINCRNNKGDTPLHLALSWNYVDLARLLVENGADLTVSNETGQISMDLARNHYTERILNMYHAPLPRPPAAPTRHQHGPRPRTSDQAKKIDSLLKAIENNDLPLACFYLGFSTGSPLYDFRSKCHPLCDCEKCGEEEERPCAVVDKINVNSCNVDGFTPLHFAAKYGRTELLRILLDSGALPNLKTYKTLQTPLHVACIYRRLAIVKELVGCECDVAARDYKDNTPLDYACAKDDAKIVGVLLRNGAEFQGQAKDGR